MGGEIEAERFERPLFRPPSEATFSRKGRRDITAGLVQSVCR
jgi:hypothetical protein